MLPIGTNTAADNEMSSAFGEFVYFGSYLLPFSNLKLHTASKSLLLILTIITD